MTRTPAHGLLGRVTAAARSHLPDPTLRVLREGGRTVREAAVASTGRAPVITVDLPTAATVTVFRAGVAARSLRRGRPQPEPAAELPVRHLDPALDSGPAEPVSGRVLVTVPDPASLVRLASSGLLTGTVSQLRVRVKWAPPWLRAGAPGIRPGIDLTAASFSPIRGGGLEVALTWAKPAGVAAALDSVLRTVLRVRTTSRHGGPLPAVDRQGWTAGAWTWPDGVLLDDRPPAASPGPGPLAPFTDPVDALSGPLGGPGAAGAGAVGERVAAAPERYPALVTAVAHPWRRKLLGEPAAYRLVRTAAGHLAVQGSREVAVFDGRSAVERVVHGELVKYAAAGVAAGVLTATDEPALLALAAVGVVLVPDPGAAADRARLVAIGLPVPPDVAAVTGTEGYAWSAAVSRAAAVAADPVLSRMLAPAAGALAADALAADRAFENRRGGPGRLTLPTVSVVLASKRPESLPAVLADLALQTWPDFEVVLGTHGWTAAPADVESWSALLGRPLRVVPAASATPFGEVLGALSRAADGDLITKFDDDDIYGPDHLTDLVLALRTTGADLVSKAPRFVHLTAPRTAPGLAAPDPRSGTTGSTVDRSWAASEVLDTTPAGGTLLFPRSTLLAAGGWSGSLRHVDIDVTARIRRAGGVTFRSHGLGYIYVRHDRGHTWDADRSVFLEQAGQVYEGLPAALASGRPAALR